MARPTTGLSTETVSRFLINAGALYINLGLPDERLLGATRDGVTFTIEQDVAELEVDGTPGPFIGGRRVVEVRPRIEATILEITPENLKLAIAGADTEDYTEGGALEPTHTAIYRDRGIAPSDYIANVAIVGSMTGSGENFIGIIMNAIQDGELALETGDSGEAGIEVSFTGHYDLDPEKINREPWEIRIPKEITSITAPTA